MVTLLVDTHLEIVCGFLVIIVISHAIFDNYSNSISILSSLAIIIIFPIGLLVAFMAFHLYPSVSYLQSRYK